MLKQGLIALVTTVLAMAPVCVQAQAQRTGDPAYDTIHQFYAARDFKPVWTGGQHFNRRAMELPGMLQLAATHGIDPQTYGVDRMEALLADAAQAPKDAEAWYQAEIFWTYDLWRYASDLAGQTVDAETLAHIVDGNVGDRLNALAPVSPLYSAMQVRLAELDALELAAAETTRAGGVVEAPALIAFNKQAFKPGMSAPAVPILRMRMKSYGAVPLPEGTTQAQAELYDENLSQAVQKFQSEYGLKSDGVIGPVTLQILNRSRSAERRQIIANMQRLREPHRRVREARRIEVSIARYLLTAFENGKGVLSMPVVVGQPRRQTISFRTEITGVRLNPTWTVPKTIRNEDFIPQLTKDPARLVRRHGLKFSANGRSFDPTQIDWSQVTPREMAQVTMWTPAGDGNPLGFYRVIMDNPYDIYLHDTNHRELFAGTMRALSSGCVRVENPQQLTDFILSGKQGWTPQKTREKLKDGQTLDVIIENKIPIYLDYMTAWLNDRGHLVLGHDIYALDKPRYDLLVNNVLTTQRNAQKLLNEAARILQPELKEARSDPFLQEPQTTIH